MDDNGDGEPDDDTVILLPETPSISLLKTGALDLGSDSALNAGDVITYSFTVSNTGNVSLSTVVLNDPLLGGVVSGPLNGDTNSDTILDVSETWIYSGTYAVTQSDIDSEQVVNTAIISGNSPVGTAVSDASDDPTDSTDVDDNGDGDPDDDTVVPLSVSPSLSLTKAILPALDGIYDSVGEIIEYELVVTNTGNVLLTNIVISDSNADAGSISPSNIASLSPGSSVVVSASHTITSSDILEREVINIAIVKGFTSSGVMISDDSDDPNNDSNVDNNADGDPDDPTIAVLGSCEVEAYNLVTPNGDGDNDYFSFGGIDCYPENTIQIYNRWGVLVYQTEGYGLNGNVFRGVSDGRVTIGEAQELPVGTYYYILTYNKDGSQQSKVGYLYIQR